MEGAGNASASQGDFVLGGCSRLLSIVLRPSIGATTEEKQDKNASVTIEELFGWLR